MRKTDGRKISPEAMEEIRIRAVQRVQAGESPEVVIKTLGFARACIYNWLARYRSGGWHGLRTGQRSGRPRNLPALKSDGSIKLFATRTRDSLNLNLHCGPVR